MKIYWDTVEVKYEFGNDEVYCFSLDYFKTVSLEISDYINRL